MTMKIRKGFLAWVVVLLLFPFGAFGQPPDGSGPPAEVLANRPAQAPPLSVPHFDDLQAGLQEKGNVQVIVRFSAAQVPQGFAAEGKLKNPKAMEAQRAAIAHLQDVVANRLPQQSAAKAKRFKHIPFMAVEVDQQGFQDLLNSPEIDLVEMDVPVPPSLTQSIPLIGGDGSGLFSGYSGAGQAVAILDTGVETSHPFFGGRVVEEACYSTTVSGQSTSVCPNGLNEQVGPGSGVNCSSGIIGCDHGTHVAGIAAGNGGSMTGVAKDADIIAIQVFANFGGSAMSWSSDQIKALERVYALRDTYNIAAVNMSLGGGSYSSYCDDSRASLKTAIDNLRSVGIATVIATGNNGYTNSISAPACISTAVSVGSTNKDDTVASYSNSASIFDLLAPGTYIDASIPGGSYSYKFL